MNYAQWNEQLFKYFFNLEKRKQVVLLDVSEQDICRVYANIYGKVPTLPEAAISCLVQTLFTGPSIYDAKTQRDRPYPTVCARIIDGYELYYQKQNRDKFRLRMSHRAPVFFAYAVGLVYSLKNSMASGVYVAFRDFMKRGKGLIGDDQKLRECIELIWNSIESFLERREGEIGYFFNKRNSVKTRRFVDKLHSQFIIPRSELLRLPLVFWELNLIREDAHQVPLRLLFLGSETKIKRIIPQTMEVLKKGNGEEVLMEEILQGRLRTFDGWSPKDTGGGQAIAEQNLAKLWLAIVKDKKTGNFTTGYYFTVPDYEAYSVDVGGQEVELNEMYWSTRLERRDAKGLAEPLMLKSGVGGLKLIFRPDPVQVYLLQGAMEKGLPGNVFLQGQQLLAVGRQYLLVHATRAKELHDWIIANSGMAQRFAEGDWILWSFEGFLSEGPLPLLRFARSKTLSFQGGLKVRGLQYGFFQGFQVVLAMEGAKGDEVLEIGPGLRFPYDTVLKGFVLKAGLPAGEYRLQLWSATGLPIEMGGCGRLSLVPLDQLATIDADDLAVDVHDHYGEEEEFMKYLHLQQSMGGSINPPPQLELWRKQRIALDEGGYDALAQELLSFIAHRGEMGRSVLDNGLVEFYRRYTALDDREQVSYPIFRYHTIRSLTEGCRLSTLSETNPPRGWVPVRPFLCRLVNASSTSSGLKGKSTMPFGGELYFLGGCVPMFLLKEVIRLADTNYSGQVEINLISERQPSCLAPPSVFIYSAVPSGFIGELARNFGITGPYHSYQLFPKVGQLTDRLEEVFAREELHKHYHDEPSCEYFDGDQLKFVPLGNAALPAESLASYRLDSYTLLTLLRSGDRSGQTDRDWGRYLLLLLRGQQRGQLYYDPKGNIIALRTTLGIPRPLDTILYLASGRLGQRLPMELRNGQLVRVPVGQHYTIYQGIIEKTAEKVFQRLEQAFDHNDHIKIEIEL